MQTEIQITKEQVQALGKAAAVSNALYELKGIISEAVEGIRGKTPVATITVTLGKPPKEKVKKNEPSKSKTKGQKDTDGVSGRDEFTNPDDAAVRKDGDNSGDTLEQGNGSGADQQSESGGEGSGAAQQDGQIIDPLADLAPTEK